MCAERRRRQRAEVAQRLGVAQPEVALVVARAQQRLAEGRHEARPRRCPSPGSSGGSGRGTARGSSPAASRAAAPSIELEVVLGEHPLVRVDRRRAERPPRLGEEVDVEPGQLGQLDAACSAAPRRRARARPAAARACPPRSPGAAPPARTRPARARAAGRAAPARPRSSAQPVEQALGLEVDRHGHIVTSRAGRLANCSDKGALVRSRLPSPGGPGSSVPYRDASSATPPRDRAGDRARTLVAAVQRRRSRPRSPRAPAAARRSRGRAGRRAGRPRRRPRSTPS